MSATLSPNGVSPNGVSPNGVSPNGVSPNGASPNGASPNGGSPSLIGVSPNGVVQLGVVQMGVGHWDGMGLTSGYGCRHAKISSFSGLYNFYCQFPIYEMFVCLPLNDG